jgi:hypothetical protein
MDLLRRSLCEDSADYESLIANMSIVLSTLDCDSEGQIIMTQPGSVILTNMFDPTETVPGTPNGFWKGCFKERSVYYYDKSCGQQSKTYSPPSGSDPCVVEAQTIVSAFLPAVCGPPTDAIWTNVSELPANIGSITNGDGSGTSEVTPITFTAINATLSPPEDGYLSIFDHCNSVCYIFWTGNLPSLGVPSASLVYVEFMYEFVPITLIEGEHWANGLVTAVSSLPLIFSVVRNETLVTITTVPIILPVSDLTFKIIADAYSCYLGSLQGVELLEDVQKVMLSFCQLLKDRIGFDRILNKTMLTIGKCDL